MKQPSLLFLALSFCSVPTWAITISFASFSKPGPDVVSLGNSVTQQGFTFTDSLDSDTGNGFAVFQASSPYLPGKATANTSLFEYFEYSTTILRQAANAPFTLSSIDLAPYNNQQGPGTFHATLQGFFADGSKVTQTLTVNRTSGAPTLQTFTLSGFTNVTSVQFRQGSNAIGDAYQFDNLVVGPTLTSVQHGATFQATALSPGLIFTLKGSGLGPSTAQGLALDSGNRVATSAGGVQVTVDSVPVPILYVSAAQINAVAPYELAAKNGQTVQVQTSYNGVAGNSVPVMVTDTAPGIFSSGSGQAAVLNQDLSYNSAANPATKGSYVSIFATGEGQTSPAGVDGHVSNEAVTLLARPLASVGLTIGGVAVTPSDLYYVGAAPQNVAGLFEVIAKVPSAVASGPQPVILTVGSRTSTGNVTLAVQ